MGQGSRVYFLRTFSISSTPTATRDCLGPSDDVAAPAEL